MRVDQFQIGTFRNFTYLITSSIKRESFVVDPQTDLTPWEEKIQELGSTLSGVLLTHTHWDHIIGLPHILPKYDVPIYVHEFDAKALKNTSKEFLARLRFIKDGEKLALGDGEVTVLHTPGHSAGECSFLVATAPPSILTGDTVFVGDVGRTDLPTGSNDEMFATLQRLKTLAPSTVIYPGHDYGLTPTSTIGRESASSAAFLCKNVEELRVLP